MHSRMREAYVWTWISFFFLMCHNIYVFSSMFFRYMGEPRLYGSRACLVLLFYSSVFPLLLGHDPVTCSAIFKQAAVHFGYPGMTSLHRGYWIHVAIDVATVAIVLPLWLFFCGPASLAAQYSFDFYFLYLIAGLSVLAQFYLIPLYARILTMVRTRPTRLNTDSSTVGGIALLRRRSTSKTNPGVQCAPRTLDSSERGFNVIHRRQSAAARPRRGVRSTSLTGDGSSQNIPSEAALPRRLQAGYGRATISAGMQPSFIRLLSDKSRDSLSGDADIPGSIRGTVDGECSKSLWGEASSPAVTHGDIPVHHRPPRPSGSSDSLSQTGLIPRQPPLLRVPSELPFEMAFDSPESSGQRNSFSYPGVSRVGRRSARRSMSMVSYGSVTSSFIVKLRSSTSLQWQTEGSFVEALKMSLRKLPQGLPALAKNVSRSVGILVRHWRFMAACRPEKFTYAAGVILPSLFLWPVWEITVPYNNVAVAILVSVPKATAILIGLLVAVYLISASSRCSEAMILAAAAAKQGISSGLVYSTASILNALLTGAPLEAGTVATEKRIREAAAVSCRWDVSCCWTLLVQEGNSTRECSIMIPRVQLFRAALEARRRGCRWFWMDTLSIPQSSEKDSGEVRAQKAAVCQRLITTMTSVYACCKRVIVVETQSGTSLFDTNHYSCRTWTLQECVLNRNLSEVPLTGEVEDLPDVKSREHLTGTTEADAWVVDNNLSNLETYEWVLHGRVTAASSKVSAGKAAEYLRFVERRHGACAADKSVALGQIFFKLLFENPEVSSQFMQELACTLAETQADGLGASPEPLLLIDNSNWDSATMTGSASMPRFLAGKPGSIQEGKSVAWTVLRLPDSSPVEAFKEDVEDSRGTLKVVAGGQRSGEWWICWMALRSRIIPVAIEHTRIQSGAHRGKSLLLKLRTCTVEEKQALEHNNRSLIETQIEWM